MQLAQFRAWFQAEIGDQDIARLLVGGQGLRLSAVAIQGCHQQRVEPFPERVSGGQLPKFVDDLAVMTEVNGSVNVQLRRQQAPLGQARNLSRSECA